MTASLALPADLDDALSGVLGADHVRSSPTALRDIGVALEPGDAPAWWLRPGSAAEIAEIVRIAGRHRIAVVPIGEGSRAPRTEPLRSRPCFFVDSRRLDHVLHLDETSQVVHAQCGLTAHALERMLAPRGLTIGDYPPAALAATLGGLVAVRTPGKSSVRHGFFEDAVLGVSAVLADGRMIHTRVAPRRATGPDLARALCGSEGTLGYITSIVLRVHRRPEARLLDAHVLPSVDAALDAVRLALREDAAPEAVRVLDGNEARAYVGPGVCRGNQAVLVCATAGPTDLAACDRDLIASAANAMGGHRLGSDVAEVWWRRRTGREPPPPGPAPVLQVAARPRSQTPVYRAVLAAVEAAGAAARAHVSRFDADGAVLFFTFTAPDGAPVDDATLDTLCAIAAAAAREAGGRLLGARDRQVDDYFAALRRELDPHDIMNPGALAG
ncbi:MAG: FAD-binding oxidoreductase [Deltaproteobacteria bacterium]|nr:MAG: FAD-binding oxidoreductase [Deltaproteobacteria bacterium]